MNSERKIKVCTSILLAIVLVGMPLGLLAYSLEGTSGINIGYPPIEDPIIVLPFYAPPYCIMEYGTVIHMSSNTLFDLGKSLNLKTMFQDDDTRDLKYSFEYSEELANVTLYDTYIDSVETYGTPSESTLTVWATDGYNKASYDMTVDIEPRMPLNLNEDVPDSFDITVCMPPSLEDYSFMTSEYIEGYLDYCPGEVTAITIIPMENWSGSGLAKLTLYDTPFSIPIPLYSQDQKSELFEMAYTYGYFEFDIGVAPVNDPPIINSNDLYRIEVSADTTGILPQPLSLKGLFMDIDSSLEYLWRSETGLITAYITDSSLTGFTGLSATGEDTLTVIANDGEYFCGFDIPVSVFEAREIALLEDTHISIDIENMYDASVQNCALIGTENIAVELRIGDQTDVFAELTPGPNWHGTGLVTLVTSPQEYSVAPPYDSSTIFSALPGPSIPPMPVFKVMGAYGFETLVAPVNDPPYIVSIPAIALPEDGQVVDAFNIKDCFGDIDSDLEYQLDDSDATIVSAVADLSGDITIKAKPNLFGTGTLIASASDGEYIASFDISVQVLPMNDVPFATDEPVTVTTAEDSNVTVNLADYITDIDSPVWYSYLANQTNASMSFDQSTWDLTVSPAANWSGYLDLVVLCSDGQYELARNLTICVTPVNDAPQVVEGGHITIDEDSGIGLDMSSYISDIDSELQFFAYSLGGNLAIEIARAQTITLQASDDWFGTDTVRIVASDGQYTVSTNVAVSVLPVNDVPVATEDMLEIKMAEDMPSQLSLSGLFTDADSDALAYSFEAGDGVSASFDEGSGLLEIKPEKDWNGDTSVTIHAYDGQSMTILVIPMSVVAVNDLPVRVHPMPATAMVAGNSSLFMLSGMFTDLESDMISIQLAGSEHLTVVATDIPGVFTVTPLDSWEGTENLLLRVSDGTGTVEESISVTSYVPLVDLQTVSVTGGYLQSMYWMVFGMAIAAMMFVGYIASTSRQTITRKVGHKNKVL